MLSMMVKKWPLSCNGEGNHKVVMEDQRQIFICLQQRTLHRWHIAQMVLSYTPAATLIVTECYVVSTYGWMSSNIL